MFTLTFECDFCGMLQELDRTQLYSDTPIITCPQCNTVWLTEILPGEPWLEPIKMLEREDEADSEDYAEHDFDISD